jgi:prevent-host-death family protein
MSRRYSVAEARAQLPTILDEVEAGSKVELTRHGRAVAVVVSVGEYERLSAERIDFKDAYARFLKHHRLKEIGIDERFAKGARDRSSGRKVEL